LLGTKITSVKNQDQFNLYLETLSGSDHRLHR
jgi:hypothetical protein